MELESKLLIATISASSAISGAVISQAFSIIRDILDKKHQRKVLLRTKYEEFAELITRSHEWLSALYRHKSIEEHSNNPPNHARKALLLAYIYFPALIKQSEKFMNSCVIIQSSMIENFQTKDIEPLKEPVKEFKENRQELDRLIILNAKKYSKA
ncbi:hypothetical protein [Desulfobacter sp.]|uniref:hypothetical protein n=1 Tax=Desulfobacter sp. TaxID=2294 RepID=UPI000E8ADFB5|nr:hypothetical protein [Desulfobacter sp.]HBT88116.1 hypothetical protein [Desulfobacter sp.]